MNYFFKFIISVCAIIGYGIYFNVPKKALLFSALSGSIGWIISEIFKDHILVFNVGIFAGALFVGLSGEVLARIMKLPSTVFIITGIISLVPGAGMYYTMFTLVQKRYLEALKIGLETSFSAVAIAFGIILSSVFAKILYKVRKKIY